MSAMIRKIHIENYKTIKSLDLELRRINILIGANGSGKSNFLSFFNFIGSRYRDDLKRYFAQNGGSDGILYYGVKNSGYFSGEIDFTNNVKYSFRLIPNIYNSLDFEYEKIHKNEIEWRDISDYNSQNFDDSLRNSLFNLWAYHFNDTGFTSPIKKICNVSDNRFLRKNGDNLSAFLYFLQLKHRKVLSNIETLINSISPNFKNFNLKPSADNNENIQLEWTDKYSDKYLNAHYLSDGLLRFICLSALLLQPEPPGIIIIDEPELGLHPSAINMLSSIIHVASENAQIIISTQLPELVNHFEPEEIIVVERKQQESRFDRLNKKELKNWMQEYSLSELWDMNVIGDKP